MMKRIKKHLATIVTVAFCSSLLAAPAHAAKTKQWYMKMIVQAEQGSKLVMDDRSGVFGRLPGAKNFADKHDVPALLNVDRTPAAVVFMKEGSQWDVEGPYLSDYRPAGANRKVWDFTVYSDMPNADVTLAWEGLYQISGKDGDFKSVLKPKDKILNKLSLIDLETGDIYPAISKGKLQSVSFNMNGASYRNFRWVQNDISEDDLVLNPAPASIAPASVEATGAAQRVLVSDSASILPAPPGFNSSVVSAPEPVKGTAQER